MKTSNIVVIIVVILIVALGWLFLQPKADKEAVPTVTSYEECVAAGYAVLESYPTKCQTPDGRTFTADVGNELEKTDLIQVSNPRPGQTIASPLEVTGTARGTWYFEASFSLYLEDSEGNRLATSFAEAESDWMTENFVPFKGTLNFTTPTSGPATLVLEKANPSGLPENGDELRIPVIISSPSSSSNAEATGGCVITGCSAQICADEDTASTCEFRPEYACYQSTNARCTRNSANQCAWVETAELKACLAQAQ